MKKILALFLVLSLICFSVASCGSNNTDGAYDRLYENSGTEIKPEEFYDDEVAKDEVEDARKIIKTYNLSLETKNFDQDSVLIVSEAEAVGGYVANSSVSGNRLSSDYESSRSARYTIRIPSKSLDAYIASISAICNVYSSSLTTEDITDSYYGIQSQLESLVIQEQKLTEMLAEAKNLQDMITLDDKLTAIRSEINALNYKLQSMDKSVNYSYVYITLNEVREYHVEEKTYLQEVGETFVESFENFADVIGSALLLLIYVLPFGLVLTAIILFVLLLNKFSQRKRMKKQNEQSENNK